MEKSSLDGFSLKSTKSFVRSFTLFRLTFLGIFVVLSHFQYKLCSIHFVAFSCQILGVGIGLKRMVGVGEFPYRLEASVERQDTREKLSFFAEIAVESPRGIGVEAATQ